MQTPRVAVLALQGDYDKHIARLRELGADAFAARLPSEIADADGVILPGGESTTIGKLMTRFGLDDALREADGRHAPIYGTCAGMIVLAKRIEQETEEKGGQATLGLLDITVARNAFGRQVDSFEVDLDAPEIAPEGDAPLRAVFIRAPIVTQTGPDVTTIARHGDRVVFVRQGHLLASSFHPELTDDPRVHSYFLELVRGAR